MGIFDVKTVNYSSAIASPSEIGEGTSGGDITHDVAGLFAYLEALFSSKSEAIKGPLYLQTGTKGAGGAKCIEVKSGSTVPLSVYYQLGTGKVGLIEAIFDTATSLSAPNISMEKSPCAYVSNLPSNAAGESDSYSGYISCKNIKKISEDNSDLDLTVQINDCNNYAKKNSDSFANYNDGVTHDSNDIAKLPNDPYIKAYYAAISALGLYILAKLMYPKCSNS